MKRGSPSLKQRRKPRSIPPSDVNPPQLTLQILFPLFVFCLLVGMHHLMQIEVVLVGVSWEIEVT